MNSRTQAQSIAVAGVSAEDLGHQWFGQRNLVLAHIDIGQGIFRDEAILGRARAGDELLQLLDAVIGLALREVEPCERDLVGKCALAGTDARDEFIARRCRPFDRGEQVDKVEFGIGIARIGGDDGT